MEEHYAGLIRLKFQGVRKSWDSPLLRELITSINS